MAEIQSHVGEGQAEFARSRGFTPAAEWGWNTPDCWVSPGGCVRIYPHTDLDGVTEWTAAVYYKAGDNVPFAHHSYRWFKEAITAYASCK
jgi:hypothetical protein